MTVYEPGTVAVATVRGVPNVRVMRYVITSGERMWLSGHRVDGVVVHGDSYVTNVRPLVVLDLDDPAAFAADLRWSHEEWASRDFANWLADQIEAQSKPPRIPEPGLWGVVEAAYEGRRIQSKWVRMLDGGPDEQWTNDEGDWVDWDDLINPVLIRPGIEGGAS